MEAHFIVTNSFDGGPLAAFANIINTGYSIAVANDLPSSPNDDLVAIPHYRAELVDVCTAAAAVCIADATIEEMLWHSLKINAMVIELCGASPRAVKECSLTMRRWIIELLDEAKKDRSIRG
jgi:hypothetical protein